MELEKLENPTIIKYLYLRGLGYKQIYKNMLSTLSEPYYSYLTVKMWIASVKEGKLSFGGAD